MKYTYITIFLLLFAYVIACAVIVPFTVDEGWTYLEFITGDLWTVVSYAHPVANNHILNTLLAKVFMLISTHELFLRMPNILAFVLYGYASYKIAGLLSTDKWIRLAFFLSLLLNTILIHFFALCRGYGLSIGLMLFSVYQLILITRYSYKPKNAHAALLFALLAVYASFTQLYFYAPAAAWLVFIYLAQKNVNFKSFLNAIKLPAIYSAVLFAIAYYPIRQMSRQDQLYYGGNGDFIHDTLFSIMQDLTGYQTMMHHKKIIMIAILLLLAVSFIVAVVKGWKRENLIYTAGPFLLFSSIVLINLHFYIAHSKLVVFRTAMFLYPLIIITIFSAICKLQERYRHTTRGISVLLTAIVIILFITQVNFDTTRDWWFDNHNKRVLKYINIHSTGNTDTVRLLAYHLTINSYNYYINTRKYPIKVTPDTEELPEHTLENFDYMFLMGNSRHVPENFRLVRSYNEGNFLLYEKIR